MLALSAEVLRRDDAAQENRIITQEFSKTVDELVRILGVKLVALVGDVLETRAVRQWSTGTRSTSDGRKTIISFALKVADMISRRYNNRTAQSWFLGLNSHLGKRVPALVLRDLKDTDLDQIQATELEIIQAVETLTER
jgi:hypothetical protein